MTVVVGCGFLLQSRITTDAFDRLEAAQIGQDADRVRIGLDDEVRLLRDYGATNALSGAAIQLQGARKLVERDGAGAEVEAAIERATELVRGGLVNAREAVSAGRRAFLAGRMPRRLYASASSPESGLIE